ncbi:hypothetical protein EVA_00545, partial [gut metagenome]
NFDSCGGTAAGLLRKGKYSVFSWVYVWSVADGVEVNAPQCIVVHCFKIDDLFFYVSA